nr:4321_t:CDS:2 [Entrophospora candida]CAG8622779.1 8938_t:CDS:2 [Entrophospora candida]
MPDGTRPEMHLPASSAIRSNFVDGHKFLSLRTNSIPFGLPSETFTIQDSGCAFQFELNFIELFLVQQNNTLSLTLDSVSLEKICLQVLDA